ncbi:acyltransferase family protein [Pelagicoccus albus]|uniref:Acyltransferase family protein n=1 Tax=Pelagicoccus albus TaxID=415222 RepID=A0A7X1E9L1_9BACT|nr:acyltransferase family protein [Pelagicoccus albus]MBC2607308.1 acyltransferase family protein [Pelagicoccus albus]
MNATINTNTRIDYLDAVRAFALLLGILFHASLSFTHIFIGWAVMDVSTSPIVSTLAFISHSFRLELFFLLAGFFSHMTIHRNGTGSFLKSRFVRIAIPFVVGWFLIRPLMVASWVMGGASMRGEVDIAAGFAEGFSSLRALPDNLLVGTHLWFLYYLLLATATILLAKGILLLAPKLKSFLAEQLDKVLSRISKWSSAAEAIAIPTAVGLYFMSSWGMDTPDKSLIPHLPTYLIYTGCFGLGWLIHRQPERLNELSKLSVVRFINLLGSIALTLYLVGFESDFGSPYHTQIHMTFAYAYSVMMWSLVFTTIGLFRLAIRRESKTIRYVADSSYWLYLIHLPVVIWLQIAVAELSWHWAIKLPTITTLAIGISLLLYDLLIRPSFVGKILNGRKKPSQIISLLKGSKAPKTQSLATS